jgi:hypothetical protein
MTKAFLIAAAAVSCALIGAFVAYGLDRGIFVGSDRWVVSGPSWNRMDGHEEGEYYVQRLCRYLFITGISEIDAPNGRVQVDVMRLADKPSLVTDLKNAGFTDRDIFNQFIQNYRKAGWTFPQILDLIAAKFPDNGYCTLFGTH